MKTTIFASLVLALIGMSAQAQILFKVEKSGSDKTSYILGTHHFAPLQAVEAIEQLPAILNSIDKLYGEIEMSQMTNPSVMMKMQKALMAPTDSTLDKVLSPAQLDSVAIVWNEYTGGAAPLELMYAVKPAVISTQLAALMAQKVLPSLNPMEGIDMTMQKRAAEKGKPVEGLETMDFQIDMLYNRPVEEQAQALMATIRDIDQESTKAVELSEAYMSHDINKIYNLLVELESDRDQESLERMIYSRNDNWVKILNEAMPDQSIMVVVGAGHLPGERGILESLKHLGYTITPIQ